MKKLLYSAIIILALFASCKKEDSNPDTLTPSMARDSLYYIMNEWYYWNRVMPVVKKEDYPDPYELLEGMKYAELDKWSFVADYDEYNAQMKGTFVGHGFRIGLDASDIARIAMIYSNSPLYSHGVRRGWIVKKINDIDVAPVLKSGSAAAYAELIGPSVAGKTNVFLFGKPDGSEVTISSTKSTFTINSVLLYDTLHLATGIAGHLVLESFITPSENELATAFAFFKTCGIKDLILDLRYNSGGYLYVAQSLASYIAGNYFSGTVFAKLQYNADHQDANTSFNFKTTSYSIGLPRLVVITTRSTASASEAVMNGLLPFTEIVSIGDITNGKPTGMNGWEIGKKYWMWPVTFKLVNRNDQGEYFNGIPPDKLVADDITHDFNDRKELCLKEAIHYLVTGSVSTKGESSFKPSTQFSEKPAWMNNTFLLEK